MHDGTATFRLPVYMPLEIALFIGNDSLRLQRRWPVIIAIAVEQLHPLYRKAPDWTPWHRPTLRRHSAGNGIRTAACRSSG